jgi:uncharacterized protein (DUF934 family)
MQFINPKQDRWHSLSGDDGPIVTLTPAPYSLLTLRQWHSVRAHWPQEVPVGVVLANDVEVTEIAAELPRLALVALNFPKWTDGRAYSQARVLRTRYRYTGQVRATGEVLVDMLPLMQRTGFDAAVLRADQSLETAERALGFFPGYYQGDVNERRPVFARTPEELEQAVQPEFIQQGSSI